MLNILDADATPTWVGVAPGKAILFGEHAVVYGQPAIAVPVSGVQARAIVTAGEPGSGVWLVCSDLPSPDGGGTGYRYPLCRAPADDPLSSAATLALAHFGGQEHGATGPAPDIVLTVRSTIPIARGMGSGAAVATAIVRALAAYCGREPTAAEVSGLVYQVERLFHGTPSGIDNTVIAYHRPIYFVAHMAGYPGHDEGMTALRVGEPYTLVIADSGAPSSTREVVADVRRGRQAQPARYDALITAIGDVARTARTAIEAGDWRSMARLMDENQALLAQLGVSSAALDRLIEAARSAGALGAKLSGAGRGGIMLAVAEPQRVTAVADALGAAGATQVFVSQVT